MWNMFANILQQDMLVFNAIERGQLIDDAFALAKAEKLPYEIALNLTKYMFKENDYLPLHSLLVNHWQRLKFFLADTPGYEHLRRYFCLLLTPKINRMSWRLSPDSSPVERSNQVTLLCRACYVGVKTCLDTAKYLFHQWLLHSGPRHIPELELYILYYGMIQSGRYEWNVLWDKYLHESDQDERNLYRLPLCQIRDPWTITYMFHEAPRDDVVSFFYACSENPVAISPMWDYIRENWRYLADTYPKSFGDIIQTVTITFFKDVQIDEVQGFFNRIPEDVLDQSFRDDVLDTIRSNQRMKSKFGPQLAEWFQQANQR